MKNKEFLVIGLGRFGSSLAQTLVSMGHTVLGIDRNEEIVQRLSDDLTQTMALDSTDEDALKEIDAGSYGTAVVAIGQNFEACLMTTVALKSAGVRYVVCKATNAIHRDILLRVGADKVALPETEAGERHAYELSHPALVGQIVTRRDLCVGEVRVGPGLANQVLREVNPLGRYSVNVVSILRGKDLLYPVVGNTKLEKGDLLVSIGSAENISRFSEHA